MTTLVTGGAGFIGTNLVHRLLAAGEHVRVLDDLSRAHVEHNVAWLRERHGAIDLQVADVRDERAVRESMRDVTHVFHFAAQVAVTTSLADPVHDFDVNGRGTLMVLEAIRAMKTPPSLLYTSTNKVYGACDDIVLVREGQRYVPQDMRFRDSGIGESRPLEFHSPYGCAKGAADQYVLDWARTYGLATCVFRMSCIYGPHQFGSEDQGWVAHFLIRALRGQPISIFGDGYQTRDVLFVDDLVDGMLRARREISKVAGQAFNIGGGPSNAVSLRELLLRIEAMIGRPPRLSLHPWRIADQRWYVSDIRKMEKALGWRPRVCVGEGLDRLRDWIVNSGLGSEPLAPTGTEASR
jgi:CDP-paratose 2-epimerase